MNMDSNTLFKTGLCIASALVGSVITALVFWVFFHDSENNYTESVSDLPLKERSGASDSDAKIESTEQLNYGSQLDFEMLLKKNSRFSQSVQLFSLVESRDEGFLLNLAQNATSLNNVRDRDLVQYAVFRRLGAMNPVYALGQLSEFPNQDKRHLIHAIFYEWLYSDIDSAIARATTMSESSKVVVAKVLLQSRYDLPKDILREIASRLDIEQRFNILLSQHTEFAFVADPEKEWYALARMDSKSTSITDELVHIATLWMQQQGVDVLIRISKSLSNASVRNTVLTQVFSNAAKLDAKRSFELAVSLPNVNNTSMAQQVLYSWGSSNPEAALKEIATVKEPGIRRKYHETVLRSWARKEPSEILEQIDLIPLDLQQLAYREAVEQSLYSEPEEAARLLLLVNDTPTKLQIARRLAREWSRVDAHASLSWALSDDDTKTDLQVLGAVLENMASTNPELALEKALEQPIHASSGVGAEAFVIAAVSRRDPEQAINMVSRLREGSKALSYKLIAYELIMNRDTDRAVELNQQVPKSIQEDYLLFVFANWAMKDKQTLIQSLGKLPTDEVEYYAARILQHVHSIQRNLSLEELQSVNLILASGEFNEVPEKRLYLAAAPPSSILYAQGL